MLNSNSINFAGKFSKNAICFRKKFQRILINIFLITNSQIVISSIVGFLTSIDCSGLLLSSPRKASDTLILIYVLRTISHESLITVCASVSSLFIFCIKFQNNIIISVNRTRNNIIYRSYSIIIRHVLQQFTTGRTIIKIIYSLATFHFIVNPIVTRMFLIGNFIPTTILKTFIFFET